MTDLNSELKKQYHKHRIRRRRRRKKRDWLTEYEDSFESDVNEHHNHSNLQFVNESDLEEYRSRKTKHKSWNREKAKLWGEDNSE